MIMAPATTEDDDKKKIEIKILNPSDIRRVVNEFKAAAASSDASTVMDTDETNYDREGVCEVWVDFSKNTAGINNDEKIIQATDLATLITDAPGGGLWRLLLDEVRIVGDFSPVLEAISSSETLWMVQFTGDIRNSKDDLVAFVRALTEMPCPWLLDLTAKFYKGAHKGTAAWEILKPVTGHKHNGIARLCVHGYSLSSTEAERWFLSALDSLSSKTKLDCLDFGWPDIGLEGPVVDAVARLFKKMTWLKTLVLTVHKEASTIALAEALTSHESIQTLSIKDGCPLGGGRTTEAESMAFLASMKNHTFTLQTLELSPSNNPSTRAILKSIKFYLTLNKLGRAKLLAPDGEAVLATTEEWMNAIADQDDISIIYYFLNKNPALCFPDPTYNNNNKSESGNERAYDSKSGSDSMAPDDQPKLGNLDQDTTKSRPHDAMDEDDSSTGGGPNQKWCIDRLQSFMPYLAVASMVFSAAASSMVAIRTTSASSCRPPVAGIIATSSAASAIGFFASGYWLGYNDAAQSHRRGRSVRR